MTQVFETEASNGKFLHTYSPDKFDARFVARMKALRGTYCRKTPEGFRWSIAADHICADDFREIAASAGAGAGAVAAAAPYSSAQLAHDMYHPNGRFYG